MLIIREVFTAKPGQASKLAKLFKRMAEAEGMGGTIMTDMVGPYNTVVMERQIANTRTMGAYQSSMQVDRRHGRALEVEAILGEPLRRAQRLGVPTPAIELLYQLVRLIDPGQQ